MSAKRMIPLLVALLLAAACDKTTTEPSASSSSTTTTTTRTTESFEATLARGDSSFYSFTVTTAGSVTVTLASVVLPGQAAPLSTPLRIGLGTPEGEGCAITDSIEVTPALTPQLTASMASGIHCIKVEDIGQVQGTVIASVRFTHL